MQNSTGVNSQTNTFNPQYPSILQSENPLISSQEESSKINEKQQEIECLNAKVELLQTQILDIQKSPRKRLLEEEINRQDSRKQKSSNTENNNNNALCASYNLQNCHLPDLSEKTIIHVHTTEGLQDYKLPLAILQSMPAYRTFHCFKDAKETTWEFPDGQKVNSLSIHLYFQSVIRQFLINCLDGLQKDSIQLGESMLKNPKIMDEFLALHDRSNTHEMASDFRDTSINEIFKDQTLKNHLAFLKIACNDPTIEEIWKESLLQYAKTQPQEEQLLKIYQNIDEYIQKYPPQDLKERYLLQSALISLLPFHRNQVDLQLLSYFCHSWIHLHLEWELKLEEGNEDILLDWINIVEKQFPEKVTVEMQIIKVFLEEIEEGEIIKRLTKIIKKYRKNNAAAWFYLSLQNLNDYIEERTDSKLKIFARSVKKTIQNNVTYVTAILEATKSILTPEEYIKIFSPLQKYAPNHFVLLSVLAEKYRKTGKHMDAILLFIRALDIKKSPDVIFNYTKCIAGTLRLDNSNEMTGELKKACQFLTELITSRSNTEEEDFGFLIECYYFRSFVFLALKEYATALEDANKALELSKNKKSDLNLESLIQQIKTHEKLHPMMSAPVLDVNLL